ncbi:MAG: flavodoxin family protein, partial [Firmicutes bacterium]|nr:flavodoxin family protein [Bacillota bacterium]
MMSMKIRAMYFTGTGTTAKITTSIAYSMWSEMKDAGFEKEADINFAVKAARDKEYIFDEKDIVVFGVPVIAGRVPNVLLKFLDTLKGGGAIAIPVVLYGNRNFDDALIELRNILEDKDFRTVAAAAFIGEHSFSKTLAAGRPDAADMKIADAFAKEAADKILWIMRDSAAHEVEMSHTLDMMGPVEVEGCDPIRDYYKPRDRHGEHI